MKLNYYDTYKTNLHYLLYLYLNKYNMKSNIFLIYSFIYLYLENNV
jgi:hypothetical protein